MMHDQPATDHAPSPHPVASAALPLPSRYWADLTTTDFQRLLDAGSMADVVVVLPLGATEQHGPHLPLSVDSDIVDGIVQAALPLLAPSLRVLVLPTQWLGQSVEHAAFPGTLSLSTNTVLHLWMDIGACVAKAGVRKLLIFNAHGGHAGLMDVVARDLRAAHGLMVFTCSWFNLPQPPEVEGLFDAHERRFGIHAGAVETSLMLALRPNQVRSAAAQNFASTSQIRAQNYPVLGNGRSAKFGWMMADLNPHGAAGDASSACADKGEATLRCVGEQLALLLGELANMTVS